MSNTEKPRVTDYIKEFARVSVIDFRWAYVDVYTRALFATVASLKSSRNVTTNYLSNSDKILTGHSTLFKLIGLRFIKKAHDNKVIEPLIVGMTPSENPLFINTFTEVISGLYQDMLSSMDKSHVDRTIASVNLIYEATLVYCWHYLNIAHHQNLIDKVLEELYLLREIEAFKNRKGE